jgi:Cys-tRNA(Pro) deacylase
MNSENPLSSANLQQFIDQNGIEATILTMPFHTPTVPDAAKALNVAEGQIVKSLVFVVNGSPLLVIANGTAKVDYRSIAMHLGVNRKKIKFATAEQALAITGYVTGSMPPFGHRQTLPTLIDPAITRLADIYGGGGDIDAMLRLTPDELLRVTQGALVSVSKDE